jgi:hypothetical protein
MTGVTANQRYASMSGEVVTLPTDGGAARRLGVYSYMRISVLQAVSQQMND